jgi:hypothetical protein
MGRFVLHPCSLVRNFRSRRNLSHRLFYSMINHTRVGHPAAMHECICWCYRRPLLNLYNNTTIKQKTIAAIIPINTHFPANQSAIGTSCESGDKKSSPLCLFQQAGHAILHSISDEPPGSSRDLLLACRSFLSIQREWYDRCARPILGRFYCAGVMRVTPRCLQRNVPAVLQPGRCR